MSRSTEACHSTAISSATGKPSRAKPMAGPSACAIEIVPKRESSASQPLTTPGTSTGSGPLPGISVRPRRANSAGVAAAARSAAGVEPRDRAGAPRRRRARRDRRRGRSSTAPPRRARPRPSPRRRWRCPRLQHLQAGRRGQRLARGDHAAGADGWRPRREDVARGTIAGAPGAVLVMVSGMVSDGGRRAARPARGGPDASAWRPFYGTPASRIRDAGVRRRNACNSIRKVTS